MRRFILLLAVIAAGCGTAGSGATGQVSGHIVLSGASSNAGATVIVIGATATATTDAAGDFTIANVPTGTRTLIAFANGYEQGTESGIDVSAHGTASAPTLTLYALSSYTPGVNPGGNPDGGSDGGVFQTTAALSGTATLLGRADFSGTTVSVAGTSLSTTTATDGTWTIANTPIGFVDLNFSNGQYQASVPNVLSLPNSNGGIFDGTLWSLVPMDVPRGQHLSPGSLGVAAANPGPWFLTRYTDPTTNASVTEVMNASTGASFALESAALDNAQISEDGQHVLYEVDSFNTITYKSISVSGGTPVTLVTSPVGQLTMGPDGTRVFYVIQSGSAYELESQPIGGGAAVTLLTLEAGQTSYGVTGYAAFSPDSSQIAVCTQSALYITATNTAAGSPRVSSLGMDCQSPQFTPDGQTVVYGFGNAGFYSVPVAGDTAPVGFTGSGNFEGPFGFSPDGNYVVMYDGNGDLWGIYPVAGNNTVLSLPYYQYNSGIQFTSDSKYALFGGSSPDDVPTLWMVDIATGGTTALYQATAPVSAISPVSLLPDGQTLLADAYNDVLEAPALVTIAVPAGTLTTLADYYSGEATLSPDGTQVAFIEERPDAPGYDLAVVPLSGASASVPQLYTYENGNIFFWLDNSTIVAQCQPTPAPYAALDGVYKVSVSR